MVSVSLVRLQNYNKKMEYANISAFFCNKMNVRLRMWKKNSIFAANFKKTTKSTYHDH